MPNRSIAIFIDSSNPNEERPVKEILDMPTIQSIRARRARGETIAEIARNESISQPTVRKYLAISDFSPKVPARPSRFSILDPYKDIIEGYLDEDERSWRKQRHNAKRIHERLVEEHGAKVGYTTVQLYVKKRRLEKKELKTGSSSSFGLQEKHRSISGRPKIYDVESYSEHLLEGYTREELTGLSFVEAAQDFVFYGKTGRGKAHLAIALGIACVNADYEVLLFSTAALMRRLI